MGDRIGFASRACRLVQEHGRTVVILKTKNSCLFFFFKAKQNENKNNTLQMAENQPIHSSTNSIIIYVIVYSRVCC